MREWVGQAVSFSIDIDDLIFDLIDYAMSERVQELSIIRRVGRGISAALVYERVISLTPEWAPRTATADLGVPATATDGDGAGDGLYIVATYDCAEAISTAQGQIEAQ